MPTLLALLSACDNMSDQPRYDPLEPSTFFSDGTSARPLVEGVIPRGAPDRTSPYATGLAGGQLLARSPVPVTLDLLRRGRERYDIFCSQCHDRVGTGQGMIVLRGFPQPPPFHDPRLRAAADGHYFQVITGGLGKMPAYGSQVPSADRWAIIAYIRALQLSQNVRLGDLPPAERARLEGTP